MERQRVQIDTETIGLSALLKWANIVGSGGEAKQLILSGLVSVNGEITTQKGKKICPGDSVCIDSKIILTVAK